MKLIYRITVLACLTSFAQGSLAADNASNNKYLGKKASSEVQEQNIPAPKVNLLEDSIIKSNPQYKNSEFWSQHDSSVVIEENAGKKKLSDKIYSIVKENSKSNAPIRDLSMQDLEIQEMEPVKVNADSESDKDGKDFKPPRTALVGIDHHHKFLSEERKYSSRFNTSQFYSKEGKKLITYNVEGKEWVLDRSGKSILSTKIDVSSRSETSYFDYLDRISTDISRHFFDSIKPIFSSDISILKLNENKQEILDGQLDFVLRDVCINHNSTNDSMLVRFKVMSEGYNVSHVTVFMGIDCLIEGK